MSCMMKRHVCTTNTIPEGSQLMPPGPFGWSRPLGQGHCRYTTNIHLIYDLRSAPEWFFFPYYALPLASHPIKQRDMGVCQACSWALFQEPLAAAVALCFCSVKHFLLGKKKSAIILANWQVEWKCTKSWKTCWKMFQLLLVWQCWI